MTISFSYTSNPQTSSQNPGEEKIAQMKKEQDKKRAELRETLDVYREKYEVSKKDFAEKQSIFLMQRRELAKHKKEDKDYAQYEDLYKQSKKDYSSAYYEKDLRLDLLQYRTDLYTKAGRLNILDLV